MVNEFDMPAPNISMRYKIQINKKKKKKIQVSNPKMIRPSSPRGKNQSAQTSLYPVPSAGFICRFAKRNCSPLDKPTFIDPVE